MSKTIRSRVTFYEPLHKTIETLVAGFGAIPPQRRQILREIGAFVEEKTRRHENSLLIFICTHNSRRSHISQLWAQAAAAYYGIGNVVCYSGGTEATAFNHRAVKAMQEAGFRIAAESAGQNPLYAVRYAGDANEVLAFSKRFDSEANPRSGFAAVMTCSHADENCPVVPGAAKRISLPYDDPKDFDDTPHEAGKYRERVNEIGTELLWAFSQVNR